MQVPSARVLKLTVPESNKTPSRMSSKLTPPERSFIFLRTQHNWPTLTKNKVTKHTIMWTEYWSKRPGQFSCWRVCDLSRCTPRQRKWQKNTIELHCWISHRRGFWMEFTLPWFTTWEIANLLFTQGVLLHVKRRGCAANWVVFMQEIPKHGSHFHEKIPDYGSDFQSFRDSL